MAKKMFYTVVCDSCGKEGPNKVRLSVNGSRITKHDLCDEHAAPLLKLVGSAKRPPARGVADLAFIDPSVLVEEKTGTRRGSGKGSESPVKGPPAARNAKAV